MGRVISSYFSFSINENVCLLNASLLFQPIEKYHTFEVLLIIQMIGEKKCTLKIQSSLYHNLCLKGPPRTHLHVRRLLLSSLLYCFVSYRI